MADVNNKLVLTVEERTVFYINADNQKRAAEVRQFDPIYGYLLLLDPFTNEEIDFGWDQVSKKWKALTDDEREEWNVKASEFNEQNNNLAKIYFESDNIVVYVINNQETNIG